MLVSQGFLSSARQPSRGQDDHAQPLSEINTTPLIDVMLVLLIMLIITIPMQTHAVKISLPQTDTVIHANPLRNRLDVAAKGAARWNGQLVGDATLARLFREVAAMAKPAEIHFHPDAAARYERVDIILGHAQRSGVTTLGFVGNEQYRSSF